MVIRFHNTSSSFHPRIRYTYHSMSYHTPQIFQFLRRPALLTSEYSHHHLLECNRCISKVNAYSQSPILFLHLNYMARPRTVRYFNHTQLYKVFYLFLNWVSPLRTEPNWLEKTGTSNYILMQCRPVLESPRLRAKTPGTPPILPAL